MSDSLKAQEPVRAHLSLGACIRGGVLLDLAIFCGSFLFFGGAHGPAGPMIVLNVLNAPVNQLFNWLFPPERTSNTTDTILMFVVVIVNGGLYGLLAGLLMSVRRRLRGTRRQQANAK
jgi:hypothetical protein